MISVQTLVTKGKKWTMSENRIYKEVKMVNRKCTALLDTGTVAHIISSRVYQELGQPRMIESNKVLVGFGHEVNKLQPMGKIYMPVGIDANEFNLQLQIEEKDCMINDVIIGREVCDNVEINIKLEDVLVKKLEKAAIMQINTEDDRDAIEVDVGELASRESMQIIDTLVNSYCPDKKKNTNVAMKVVLVDETFIPSSLRRLAPIEEHIVEEQKDQLRQEGVIEEADSEFSSPKVLVDKKDGCKRLCVGYRRLNKVTVSDRFPLPRIEDQLDRMKDAQWYSTIYLKNGFFHMHVDVESQIRKLRRHMDSITFCMVPFGLTNSPAIF